MIKSRLAFIHFVIVLSYILFGCGGTNTILREVPIYIEKPAIIDTVQLVDTVMVGDSLWYGNVTDSLGQVIGDLKVYFKTKIAELKLNAKKDTVWYIDTVKVDNVSPDNGNSLIGMANNVFTWWEKGIIYGGLGMILSFLIYLRVKRGKII